MNTDIDRIEKGDLLFPLWVISSVLHEFLGYFIPPLHWHLTNTKKLARNLKILKLIRGNLHMDGHSKSIRCACEHIFFLSCLISAGLKALKFVCGVFGSSFVTDTCKIFLIDRGKCIFICFTVTGNR